MQVVDTSDVQDEISFEWTPRLVGVATRRFIAREAGWRIPLFAIVLVLATAGLIATRNPMLWALVVLPIVGLGIWWKYYVTAVGVAKQIHDRRLTVRFEPETVTFAAPDHTSVMKWSRIKEVWQFPEVWLFFIYGRHSYTIVPASELNPETQRFIADKVREHGGRVR